MSEKVNRRNFIKSVGLGAAAVSLSQFEFCSPAAAKKPNIVFILADDLGYNELGCYGQEKIRTPNIDKIAAEGMRFTQHYSGSPVCAPSRCTLLTGKHTGHAFIRGNDEMSFRGDVWYDLSLEGQRPIPDETVTVAELLKKAGYTTGAVGKWGLGGPGSTGEPNNQGFDFWYGYLCQRIAHNYYPAYLWKNREKDVLEGNEYFHPHQRLPEDKDPNDKASYEPYTGEQYSMDRMAEEALNFIKENKDNPFFLYLPFPVPHVSIQVPEDSLAEYEGKFDDTPYKGDQGYVPHIAPRAAFAAMITRMDREIGRIMQLLKDLDLDDNTLVIFTSDNGPTYNGGTDSEFFNSAGVLRGLKGSVYEGGIRIPMIARWPGKIDAGTTNDHISAFWDFLPTLTELTGAETPADIDGVSLLPTLIGNRNQIEHEYLYWEHSRRLQAVRMGDWKAVRLRPSREIELYNLKEDIGETTNVAGDNPELIEKIKDIMVNGRTESELFPLAKT
ncbi:arylsulfatase [candidate division KSB1 bacterium]